MAATPTDQRLGDATSLEQGWTLELHDGPDHLRRVREALCTVADGLVGTRGTPAEDGPGYRPLVVVAGVYSREDGSMPRLLPGPLWFREEPPTARERGGIRAVLDLRDGVLYRRTGDSTALRFASLARPGTMVERRNGGDRSESFDVAVAIPAAGAGAVDTGAVDDVGWVRVRDHGTITAAVSIGHDEAAGTVDRIAVVTGRRVDPEDVVARVRAARRVGVDELLAEHRARWRDRWDDAYVAIGGDESLESAVRFGLFHLMASVADRGEAAVGARGLSGPAYAGHVFWDADVFVLPVLAATHPASARAMLEYRLRRLPAARRRARRDGRAGARFPWESADSGEDVTPRSAMGLDGAPIAIRTGQLEEHIVADVAWAARCYATWTGDTAFLDGDGRGLLVDTARYWASRIEVDADGTGHIRGVIGPDEYHEDVDDNAFTNVMARWNLRQAVDLCAAAGAGDVSPGERTNWIRLADALVDGYDADAGRHEQFVGYSRLDPVRVDELAPPPVAADVLLGPDRVAATQVIKQPDVLMLHHLVPEEMTKGSLQADLDHYLPRTAHGSSLSPAICAGLLARAGRPDQALPLLRLAARLDLDDRTGSTASGLHLATMGGVWQALAFGFAGLRVTPDGLEAHPNLPAAWTDLVLTVRAGGARYRIRATHAAVDIARVPSKEAPWAPS